MSLKRQIRIIHDDLLGEPTRDLLRLHLRGMHDSSPPGTSFALDLSGLESADVTVWSAWIGSRIAGIGALKALEDGCGEVKSMRTHPDFLRQGVATQLLEHIIHAAQDRGMRRLSLETGTGPAFEAAIALYQRRGFVSGPAFADYPGHSSFNEAAGRRDPAPSDAYVREAAEGYILRSCRVGAGRRFSASRLPASRKRGTKVDRPGA